MDLNATRPSLLSRIRDPSDHVSWAEFEARYGEMISRYCRRRGLRAADVEDIRQIVLMNLSKSLRGFEYEPARGRFRDYLGRSVRRAIQQYFSSPNRSNAALDSGVLASVPALDEGAADEAWEREWVDHHYRTAMEQLRTTVEPKSIQVFERILAGDGVDDVAAAFDMTPEAVYKVKNRIRDRLKDFIAVQIREEEEPNE